jgi:8-oxo-dGTP diphosphatase
MSKRSVLARPRVAVDTVLFALERARLKCLLVQLKHGALKGKWAFPGRLVRAGEQLDDAARYELRSTTGLSDAYLEQMFTFGDPSRDPRGHVVSVAYMALIADPAEVKPPAGKYAGAQWFEVSSLPPLAYDHKLMADYALRRLKAKLGYTNIAYNLLPETYAAILGRSVDRRNFRRRILGMKLLRELPGKRFGRHRPAALYSFVRRTPQVVEVL